jgi:hypothetical protein
VKQAVAFLAIAFTVIVGAWAIGAWGVASHSAYFDEAKPDAADWYLDWSTKGWLLIAAPIPLMINGLALSRAKKISAIVALVLAAAAAGNWAIMASVGEIIGKIEVPQIGQ